MAKNTPLEYRNQVMYSVYVRSHTPAGTFEGLRRDLDRIKSLGVDVVWLMPIHPIGQARHKGSLGCPYAIRDYRAVNPEYGTLEDFSRLVSDIHSRGMKCIIDVVYNHTSPDSVLAAAHPEWFHHGPDGAPVSRVEDWSDVVDLDYANLPLWDYQIETLKYWAGMVDGFRCDVASLVPLDFWLRARREVEAVRPGCLWLAESVEPGFISFLRGRGYACSSDAELYQAFDVTYDYDVAGFHRGYLQGKTSLGRYVEELARQDVCYPGNYVKLRFLENHDVPRAADAIPDPRARLNWTAFQYFQRGMALLYAGQEAGDAHTPSLFDKDPVNWTGPDQSAFLRRLAQIKRDPIMARGAYTIMADGTTRRALPHNVVAAEYMEGARRLVGCFSLRGQPAKVNLEVPDGRYVNLCGDGEVEVRDGMLACAGAPVIIDVK